MRNICCGRKNKLANQKKAITDILQKIDQNMTNSTGNISELFQNGNVDTKIVPEKCDPLGQESHARLYSREEDIKWNSR